MSVVGLKKFEVLSLYVKQLCHISVLLQSFRKYITPEMFHLCSLRFLRFKNPI